MAAQRLRLVSLASRLRVNAGEPDPLRTRGKVSRIVRSQKQGSTMIEVKGDG